MEYLFQHYGYGVITLIVMLESMGLPLPAETLIISASLYCAATHHMDIGWVAVAAIVGAIIGDNIGYIIGRMVGIPLLQRYGARIGMTPDRLLLGRFLFRRHGSEIVFFGRFIAVVRVFVALLAGANHMTWPRFMIFNAAGGICWAGGYAMLSYYLGHKIMQLSGPASVIGTVTVVIGVGGCAIFLRRNEKRLTDKALQEARQDMTDDTQKNPSQKIP
ncbi:DedA family protein [Novacetimonas hansenii]|uniref:DedA family protein n=1 Tax=Novacetimonas hansenii TaxID=436 RepID=UPI00094FF6E5|nr:DedA family protein [Novacetimonas hansenii]